MCIIAYLEGQNDSPEGLPSGLLDSILLYSIEHFLGEGFGYNEVWHRSTHVVDELPEDCLWAVIFTVTAKPIPE